MAKVVDETTLFILKNHRGDHGLYGTEQMAIAHRKSNRR